VANTISSKDWEILIDRVASGQCTPFLGAGASAEVLPAGAQLAQELAKQYHYPLADGDDLVRVAQFIAVHYDAIYPKEQVLKRISDVKPPNFNDPGEPHAFFARLQLPVYMTTNYDDFLTQALRRNHRDVRQDTSRWNSLLQGRSSPLDAPSGYRPTVANPLVYHLHGYGKPESIVLTEDDYLEFLENLIKEPNLLPEPVTQALQNASLLFVGYRVTDWNLRVILRLVRPAAQTLSVVVLKPPTSGGPDRKQVQDYMERYYERLRIRVYWGTARKFCAAFSRRLKAAGVTTWGL